MIADMRPMDNHEIPYCYSQDKEIALQAGLIGYLRADMGSNGLGFYSSWNDYQKELNNDEFKRDLDKVINDHRAGHNFLANRDYLREFCFRNADLAITNDLRNFGARMDTEKYSYMVRLNPNRGEYNLYCYCYVKETLDKHLKEKQKEQSPKDKEKKKKSKELER